MRRARLVTGVDPAAIPFEELLASDEPVILAGVALDWPLVRAGLDSPGAAIAYLKRFAGEQPVVEYRGPPEIAGRFFYDADLTGLNFAATRQPLSEVLDRLAALAGQPDAPSLYVGSTDIDLYLPGLRRENDLPSGPDIAGSPARAGIWIGNRTIAATHYDMSNNLACNMVGRRRFTLFPPDQVHNLYPGPLEPTPGGQVVSMVDLAAPDLDRYPRFAQALAAAWIADLAPGDALIYPALWWHQVEALDDFNVMINYWWNAAPAYMDSPQTTLLHALLSLRDRPPHEKRAWRALFDYYVFGPPELAGTHLPEPARGDLAALDDRRARRLRAQLLSRLNR